MKSATRTQVAHASLDVVEVSVVSLRPWERNPRRITPARLAQLMEQMVASPEMLRARPLIVLPDGVVIAGNQRLAAAVELGWESIPCVVVDLDEATAIQWALRDNNSAGENDADLVAQLLGELQGAGVDVLLAGFAPDETRSLLARLNRTLVDPDAVPEVPVKPRSKRGVVYELGLHRLMCGDATSDADVAVLLAGAKPLLCVTDPPYGVSYDPKWRNVAAAEVLNDDRSDWREAWDLFPGDVMYSWHPAGATSLVHAAALQDSGFVLRMQIIWSKSNFPIGRGDYHVRHEPCWYAVRKGKPAHRNRDRTQTTVWEVNLDANAVGGHSTQKPVECMARPIRNHTFREVYDPFCGSGTTVIAAEMEGSVCYAMELDPGYCDVIRQRYADYTNQPHLAP